ncbi:hypothetical protein CHS0354_004916 [Potamilus streckersoni]|uniref:Uncharacterized protein n=1 Tax=Potamilus streckersoni TaxID=2493646 RepID=A0AAE0WFD2_9BIVA|nr:hypothetical protein CHS0354_004916 [Potamilus streckersoni]
MPADHMVTHATPSSTEALETYRIKDFRRQTLSVIHENGSEPTSPALLTCNSGSTQESTIFDFNNTDTDEKDDLKITGSPSNDLSRLKATASKLNLRTRRSSYMLWRDRYIGSNSQVVKPTFCDTSDGPLNNTKDSWTQERTEKINNALEWLRKELQAMRFQDQELARQFLSIRHDIHQLKLQRSCEEHKEMLEDITQELEEAHELDGLCDLPFPHSVNEFSLRHIGVTRMNLSARRFSTC